MSFDGRLRKLEQKAKPEEPCPECGLPPKDPNEFGVFTWGGVQDPDEPLETHCAGCGRILNFTLDITRS